MTKRNEAAKTTGRAESKGSLYWKI